TGIATSTPLAGSKWQLITITMTEGNHMQPDFRFRRLRRTPALRDMVRQFHLHTDDLILPIFEEEGIDAPLELGTMPGVFRHPETALPDLIQRVWKKGIKGVILFGVSHHKDAVGSDAWNEKGLMARIIRSAKQAQP